MNVYRITLALLCATSISGCIEKETTLSLYYENITDRHIQVFTFPGDPFSVSSDTSWFDLTPFEEIRVRSFSNRGESSTLQSDIFPNFSMTDSCVVVFSDTLKVTHFTRSFSLDQDSIREDVIGYDDGRNMFNQAIFSIERTGDNLFKATYTFTTEDVDYAISINE